MSERVPMPALGESVTEGTVTRWLKSVGDEVAVDEPLLEVSTDKVDTEIPSPVAGVLQEILAEEDETVEVGADLCVIGDGSGSSDSGSSDDSAKAEESEDAPAQDQQGSEQEESDSRAEADKAAAGSESNDESNDSASGSGGEVSGGETVTMPALGESVTEGTVTRWLKSEGDDVEVDEPLLEVSTDKVDTEIPSPVAGKLTKIIAQEDETVEVGGDLCIVGGEAGGSSAPKQEAPKQEEAPEQEAPKADEKAEAAEEEQGEAGSTEAEQEQDKAEEPKQEAPKQEAPKADEKPAKQESKDSSGDAAAYVTPLVRKLAQQHGIDLGSIEGTGVGGRIRKQDVLDAAEAKKAAEAEKAKPAEAPAAERATAPAPGGTTATPQAQSAGKGGADLSAKRGTTEKMSRLRKVIASRMVESLQVSAQLTTVLEVDMTKVARLRAKHKAEFERVEGTKLSYLPFIAVATIEALKEHPVVNASVEDDQIVYHASENLSIAVDTDKGLIVPVVKNAGDLNIAGLARAIADVADRTRSNKITPDDLSGGTFTITNTGSRGALFDTPIINQPQVGILGTGAIVKRPVVVTNSDGDETIAVRSMMYLALSYDHRIVDGADAARFLTTIKERLEDGQFEL